MRKGKAQRSVSAHGDSADGPSRASRSNAVFVFNMRHELLQEKIAVADRPAGGIDVKTSPAFRRDHQEITHLMLLAQIVEQRPAATVKQRPFVVAQAVQKVQRRIALRRLRRTLVISRWQVDAVVDDLLQNAAVQGTAVDPALCGRYRGHEDGRGENGPVAE